MAKTTNKTNGNKVSNVTTTTTNNAAAAQLSEQQIAAILQGLINEAGGCLTMSALRKQEQALSDKYGKSNWISIRAYFHAILKRKVDAAAEGAIGAVKDYAPALAEQFARISTNKDFQALASYIGMDAQALAKQWTNGARFVAACYPHQIDKQPARRVSYVTDGAGYIVDAMQPAQLTAASVPSILSACIRNIRSAAYNAISRAQALAAVKTTTYKPAQVIAVFMGMESQEKVVVKGDAVKGDAYAAIAGAGIKGLPTLAEYRKQAGSAEGEE